MIYEALITGSESEVGSTRCKENSQANHTVKSIRQGTLGSFGLTKSKLDIIYYKPKYRLNHAE